jgi:hypothetical protein
VAVIPEKYLSLQKDQNYDSVGIAALHCADKINQVVSLELGKFMASVFSETVI